MIGQLARRVDRVEEVLEAFRDDKGPDRRGFDELRRRLIDQGIEEQMKRRGRRRVARRLGCYTAPDETPRSNASARGLTLLAAALVAAVPAGAGERLEIAGYAGYTFPFYSQTFRYDPGQVTVPIPGVSVEQSGEFEAKASGGPAFAGGITLYATSGLGLRAPLRPRGHHGGHPRRELRGARGAAGARSIRW